MLRAIIREKIKDQYNGAEYERLFTINFECPELESALRNGGQSESGYQIPQLVGIEVLQEPE